MAVEPRKMTHAELLAEARRRFGDDVLDIAFTCGNCGDTATIREFRDAGNADVAGQECIGRLLGALGERDWKGRGCNWSAYGLIPGPWIIEFADGKTVRSFPLAEPARAACDMSDWRYAQVSFQVAIAPDRDYDEAVTDLLDEVEHGVQQTRLDYTDIEISEVTGSDVKS